MLWRFSLYGFLKNQRYFEPFLVLIFLEKGLSFFSIGLLIGFREVAVNLLEIPSGAIVDVCGRRRVMILSFVAYVVSFAVFGLAEHVPALLLAMFLFAIGEAFRTGTHKALIFTWLRQQGRIDERLQVYGYTRSWSKYGSALSVVLAALFVYTSDSYTRVFYYSIVPYLVGIANFLGYPRELDADLDPRPSAGKVVAHLREALGMTMGRPDLRRLLLESMGFGGVFEAAKDFLQPVLKAAAIGAAAHWILAQEMSETQRVTLLVGPVYFLLHLLSGLASRNAHRVALWAGGEEGAARRLWGASAIIFAGLGLAAYFGNNGLLIAAFVILHAVQNFWRPVLISRFDAHGAESQGATLLSIESQGRRTSSMLIAPALGLAIDRAHTLQTAGAFWPVGALGFAVALAFLALRPIRR